MSIISSRSNGTSDILMINYAFSHQVALSAHITLFYLCILEHLSVLLNHLSVFLLCRTGGLLQAPVYLLTFTRTCTNYLIETQLDLNKCQ